MPTRPSTDSWAPSRWWPRRRSRPCASARVGGSWPSGILLEQRIQIQRSLRNRHQLVLVRNRAVVGLRKLAGARLRVRHALLDARLGPRPVALVVEVAVRPLERELPAALVEHGVAEQIMAQARRHCRNAGARANGVHRG